MTNMPPITMQDIQAVNVPSNVIEEIKHYTMHGRNPEALDTIGEYRMAFVKLSEIPGVAGNLGENFAALQKRLAKELLMKQRHIPEDTLDQADKNGLILLHGSVVYLATNEGASSVALRAVDFKEFHYSNFEIGKPIKKMVLAGERVFALTEGGGLWTWPNKNWGSPSRVDVKNENCYDGGFFDMTVAPDGHLYLTSSAPMDGVGVYSVADDKIYQLQESPRLPRDTTLSFNNGRLEFKKDGRSLDHYNLTQQSALMAFYGDCPVMAHD